MTYAASALLFLLVTLGGLTRAWAAYVYPPLVPPVDQQTTLTLNLERSTLGSTQHYIWNQQRNGWGGDNAPYAQNHWLCYSATDATYGAGGCFESIHSGPLPSAFALTFTEQISRATHTINLNGHANLIGCGSGLVLPINSFNTVWCMVDDSKSLGKMLTVWVDEQEIKKLPFGGLWKAQLKLKQRNWGGPGDNTPEGYYSAYWTADIRVNLHDNKNFSIWFPHYQTNTPRLDLALHTLPTPAMPGGKITGKSTLDMCLYDGYGGNSTNFEVTLLDGKTIGDRASEDFSLFRNGVESSDRRKRIDYRIQLDYDGQTYTLLNNQPLLLTQVNQSALRLVKIPSIAQAVLCAPTPLTFITPEFNQNDKESGSYLGYVRVLFTPRL